MKKYLLLFFISIFFIFTKEVYAYPIITNNKTFPENIWCNENICENISISLECYDSDGKNITQVYGRFTYPLQSDNQSFNKYGNNSYILNLTNLHFDPNKYTFSIYCQNNASEINETSVSFNVSWISATISSIKTPIYLGDGGEMSVLIEKDGYPLSSNEINFNLKLGGQNWTKYYFYKDGNWIIKFDSPNVLGVYDLDLEIYLNLASYNPKKLTIKSSVEVRNVIDFNILSIDKTEVRPNDIVTISLSASERGNNIILRKDHLSFQIGFITIPSDTVTLSSAGNHFDAKISMPDLSPGSYELKVTFNYANYSTSRTRDIYYILPISGKFVDLNNKGINVEIKFLVDNVEKKKFVTDSSGSYSGYVVPGTYTIQLNFPQSTLYLYGARVSSFNDPIKYYFSDIDIEGIKTAGSFVYEVTVPFTSAKIVMNYDEKKVTNEKNIVVYKCSEFNPANKICNTDWEEQTATLDTVANSVTVETDSLSAYVVGTKKSLHLDFSSEKNVFSINELIRIRGTTRDESGSFIQNVLVNASIYPANIKASTYSDSNGVFTIEFFAPGEEGVYNLLLKAEKVPYFSSNKTWNFQVLKERSISLIVPDTIRIRQGENLTLQFSVVNTGQVDISNLSISLIGLPKEYFYLQEKINELRVGQEVKIPVNFKIPKDAAESTLSLTFKVNSSEITKEKVIGFTIFSENTTLPTNQTATHPIFSFPTAYLVSPVSLADIAYALIFGAAIISVAYFLRRGRVGEVKERRHIKNLLSDIKNEIKRRKSVHPMQVFNQLVEGLSEKSEDEK